MARLHRGETPERSTRRHPVRLLVAGCALGALPLGAFVCASGGAPAGASPPPLHVFQKESVLTFMNAADDVIQGYPPVGGHVLENDVDYVGNHSHHAKRPTMTDHVFCTVVTAPATADCSFVFATGDSLLYSDADSVNLAGGGPASIPLNGGTGTFAGDSGTAVSTTIGNSNNSDVVLTLHRS